MYIFSGDWLYIWKHRGGNGHKALATKAHSKVTTLDLVEWKLKPKVKAIHYLLVGPTISQAIGFEPGFMGHWPQTLGYYLVTAHCWIS